VSEKNVKYVKKGKISKKVKKTIYIYEQKMLK